MRLGQLALSVIAIALGASAVFCDEGEQNLRDYKRLLASLNQYSPLEGAGSHGVIGTTLGLGRQNIFWDRSSLLHKSNILESQTDEGGISLTKLFLVKGISDTLDLGLSAGQSPLSSISSAGGHLQWTIFQRLGLPAASMRLHYIKTFGLTHTQSQSAGASLVSSFSFLRYFQAYAYGGLSFQTATIQHGDLATRDLDLFLADATKQTTHHNWISDTFGAGFQVTLLPPSFFITGEAQMGGEGVRCYLGKLSIGI